MNACPVTVYALNCASTLQAPIFVDAVLDSFWIQMAELAQVNFNALSQEDVICLKQPMKPHFVYHFFSTLIELLYLFLYMYFVLL